VHQRERRARDAKAGGETERAAERAGEKGFSGAELAGKDDKIAGREQRRDSPREIDRCAPRSELDQQLLVAHGPPVFDPPALAGPVDLSVRGRIRPPSKPDRSLDQRSAFATDNRFWALWWSSVTTR